MESIQSRLVKLLLRLIRKNKLWKKSGGKLEKGIKRRRRLSFEPPRQIRNHLSIKKTEAHGHVYYEMKPLQFETEMQILYTHGGGYVNRITKHHWLFLSRLVNELECTITVPLYPLAPEHTYKDTYKFIYPLYQQIAGKVKNPSNLVLMGDSAGGGIALALARLINEKQDPKPARIILISPWLDLHLTNPEIKAIEKKDPFLVRDGVVEAGKMYAGDTERSHYLLSPALGKLSDLGEMTIVMGTHDILAPDARKLVKKAKEQGVTIDYYEAAKMVHVFPFFTFPEARTAFRYIAEKLK
ncbi:alpha/beta hydrolase [Halobacillus sp. A5]|uniref:alpha/beta hydrolase n=1 Tax=Halobacillus sp. A5 TaxID=2880263 RepID=UPI0020A65151|nr:alpha/beta hydrolase [Halobacillus sp. A5]MCP3028449.1 alpha/beta hydrolase [Halobacillus sp. A5]